MTELMFIDDVLRHLEWADEPVGSLENSILKSLEAGCLSPAMLYKFISLLCLFKGLQCILTQ